MEEKKRVGMRIKARLRSQPSGLRHGRSLGLDGRAGGAIRVQRDGQRQSGPQDEGERSRRRAGNGGPGAIKTGH